MKCDECKNKLIDYIEDLLEEEKSQQCQKHIAQCSSCKEEYKTSAWLKQQLVVWGKNLKQRIEETG